MAKPGVRKKESETIKLNGFETELVRHPCTKRGVKKLVNRSATQVREKVCKLMEKYRDTAQIIRDSKELYRAPHHTPPTKQQHTMGQGQDKNSTKRLVRGRRIKVGQPDGWINGKGEIRKHGRTILWS